MKRGRPHLPLLQKAFYGKLQNMKKQRMQRIFTAVFEKHAKWYVGYVEEIPGVNTQGRTLAEARKNLREALGLILETNRLMVDCTLSTSHSIREPLSLSV